MKICFRPILNNCCSFNKTVNYGAISDTFFEKKSVNAFIKESLNSVSIHNLLKKIFKSIVNTIGMIENVVLTGKFVSLLQRENNSLLWSYQRNTAHELCNSATYVPCGKK